MFFLASKSPLVTECTRFARSQALRLSLAPTHAHNATMERVTLQSLRQLAIGSDLALRPLAQLTAKATTTTTLASRAASTATFQATRLPRPKKVVTTVKDSSKSTISRPTVPYKRYRQPKPELTNFAEGHGEQIWIFNHIVTNQIVYSHTPVLRVSFSYTEPTELSACSMRLLVFTNTFFTEQSRVGPAAL